MHLMRAYRRGKKKIYKDLNVYHLIKRLNQLENITYFQSKMSGFSTWVNKHSGANVIDVDEENYQDFNSSDENFDEKRKHVQQWFLKYKIMHEMAQKFRERFIINKFRKKMKRSDGNSNNILHQIKTIKLENSKLSHKSSESNLKESKDVELEQVKEMTSGRFGSQKTQLKSSNKCNKSRPHSPVSNVNPFKLSGKAYKSRRRHYDM